MILLHKHVGVGARAEYCIVLDRKGEPPPPEVLYISRDELLILFGLIAKELDE